MLKVFQKQLEYAKSPPNIPEWEEIANAIHMKVEEAIMGEKTVEQILSELNSEITEILKKKK